MYFRKPGLQLESLCLLVLLFPWASASSASTVTPCVPNSTDIVRQLTTDTNITLERGNYCVSEYVLVANKRGFRLAGTAGSPSDTIIQCSEGAGLAFLNVTQLTLSNVNILNCGVTGSNLSEFVRLVNESVDMFYTVPDGSSAAVLIAASTNVTLLDVEIRESRGYGLIAINLYGEVNVIGAVFASNRQQSACTDIDLVDLAENKGLYVGGGALVMFFDAKEGTAQPSSTKLTIADTVFVNNSACYTSDTSNLYFQISDTLQSKGYIIGGGGGLSLKACQSSFQVEIDVENSSFSNNIAGAGGGANVATFRHTNSASSIRFRICNFTSNAGIGSQTTFGGGLAILTDLWYKDSDVEGVRIIVEDCTFRENSVQFGGAVVAFAPLIIGESTTFIRNHINFTGCDFLQNRATYGSAVYIGTRQGSVVPTGPIYTFDGCNFTGNNGESAHEATTSPQGSGALHIANAAIALRNSCITGTNVGSAIWAETAYTVIEGTVTMTENSALYGGGITIIGFGFIIVRDNSQLIIKSNTAARFGGGVFYSTAGRVAESNLNYDCFLLFGSSDPFCPDCTFQGMNVSIAIMRNHAILGSVVYGSLLDSCPWSYNLTAPYGPGGRNKSHTIQTLYEEEYAPYFNFSPDLNETGAVNTQPVRPHVESRGMDNVEIMPGQYFSVTGNALDRLGQSVSDFVALWVLNTEFSHGLPRFSALVGEDGLWLMTNNFMTVARVFGPQNSSTTVAFTSLQSAGMSLMTVTLTNCSNGFFYNETSKHCTCDPKFKNFRSKVTCDETYANISVKSGVWFGNLNGDPQLGTDTDNYVADFCLSIDCKITHSMRSQVRELEWIVVNTSDLDSQCPDGGNRGGLFCGRCRKGFSVMLGTSRCGKCNGTSGVIWIILFAFLGIVLLAGIAFLKVNVSDGWINGVILYANIYTTFSGTLIPRRVAFPGNFQVYFLFSWLSLQWGIQTCFYEGLSPLAHNGLELVFPVYLVLLVLATVVISRLSLKEKWLKLFGNPLKVIATLLLLIFSAFMGVCLRLLGFSTVSTFSGEQHIRWSLDSNEDYFKSPARIILVLLSVALILVLLTFSLFLLVPCRSGKYRLHCCARAQRRAHPFIDAFQAPFKDTLYASRTWEGWRFFFRIILHIIANTGPQQYRLWWLLFALLLFHSAQSLLSPYKFWGKNLLDSFFTLNMSLLVVLLLVSENFDIPTDLFLSFYHLMLTSALLASLAVIIYSISPVLKAIVVKFYARVCSKEVSLSFDNSYVDPAALQVSDLEEMTYCSVHVDPARALDREHFVFEHSDSNDNELKGLSN